MTTNIIKAEGEANLVAEAQTEIEVVAPQLQVALTGPKVRYLERNATHSISVSNPGTAAAKNIDLVAVLPKNLKFVEANNRQPTRCIGTSKNCRRRKLARSS
jgi:uncharacterized repeat protein (TIGR01451 family)